MPPNADESLAELDLIVDLLWFARRFELAPGTTIKDSDHLVTLIEENLSRHGQIVNDSGMPFSHNQIEVDAMDILSDQQYGFANHLSESQLIPDRLERLRFSRLFGKKTGLSVRYSRIPHICYLPLLFVLAGLYAIAINGRSLGIAIIVISVVASFFTWLYFTSKKRTIGDFADAVFRDNFDNHETLSRGDLERLVAVRFPNGLAGVTIPHPDDGG